MSDDFIQQFDPPKPPRPEFTAALYQRISKPMKTTSRTHALRYLALVFTMVAIVAGVLFFSPPTRALADSIIHQFGGVIFVQDTSQHDNATNGKDTAGQPAVSPEQKAALAQTKIASKPETTSQTEEVQKPQSANDGTAQPTLDANSISQLVGFTVYSPAYLPNGYTAALGGWRVSQEDGRGDGTTSQINGKGGLEGVPGGAVNSYVNQAAGEIITIEEFKSQPSQPKTVDSPQIQDVTVRGQSGVWLPDNGGMNTLAWEENGITYLVVGNTLSLDEALKIAESLGK